MRRKDREITDPAELRAIVEKTKILHLALADGEYPYIVPMHYGFEFRGEALVFYLHCAKEGHKLDLIGSGANACAELENDVALVSGGEVPCRYGAAFSSVIAKGTVCVVDDRAEKVHGLGLLMLQQTGKAFELTEEMADPVTVLRFTSRSVTAKARKIT